MKPSEKVYLKYEYLAKKYASKIFSYEALSFEYDDLVQEFRLKIFTSIKAYGRRYARFLRGQASRPVPLKYYLEAACGNKARDFMKYITREGHKVRIDEINYDYGVEVDSFTDTRSNRFYVNGVNLLEGLSGKERAVFSLFLRGYNTNFLRKVYFSNAKEKALKKEVIASGDEPIDVTDIIEAQRQYLIKRYGSALMEQRRVYSSYSVDDD
jgi:DNA-directed RNA polymerase specialized sigma24 family protein